VAVTPEKLEPVHQRLGHPASPTPATDGQRVYVYFGSFGLLAYDYDGKEVWRRPLPMPVIEYGTSSSPILAGGLLVVNCDQDLNSYLLAVEPATGKTVWRAERPEFPRGFTTPFLWRLDGVQELVVAGTVWLKAYDVWDGQERWKVRGLTRVVCPSPIAGEGLLFMAAWSPGADAGNRIVMPPYAEFAREHDRNKDGVFGRDEVPNGPFLERFSQLDVNKDKAISEAEWKNMEQIFAQAQNCLLAVRPGGRGDITATHVVWRQTRGLPYVPCPLYYRGRVYLVKDGGLVSCYQANNGHPVYLEERLGALGDYYASPVAADGRIYAASLNGAVVVFAAGDTLEVLARNNLGESVLATPAILEDKLYIRSATQLWAFGDQAGGP
jgi:outer membrane protein assembly factor BamB